MYKEFKNGRIFAGRLNFNDDILNALTEFCTIHNIKTGSISLIGALQHAKVGYYNQSEKKYNNSIEFNKKLEIVSCIGNISLKDGQIFIHAHIVLSDTNGNTFGGHLIPGCNVFAAEFWITEFIGEDLVRAKDEITGLYLWNE